MATTWFGGRVEASRRTLALAVGDAAMIALFVLLGEIRHGGTLAGGVETFVQFGIGWTLAALAAAVYGPDALRTPSRAVVQGFGTWVVAALIGQLVRVAMTPGSFVQLSFVLVSIGFGGAFLAAWRYLAARFVLPHHTPYPGE